MSEIKNYYYYYYYIVGTSFIFVYLLLEVHIYSNIRQDP